MVLDPLEEEVKRFVVQELAIRYDQLTLETRLLHDIGVCGDEGYYFMKAFGEKYRIDLSDFDSALHFGGEGGCNPFCLLLLLFYRRPSMKFTPVTVGDLIDAARSKKWITPKRDAIP